MGWEIAGPGVFKYHFEVDAPLRKKSAVALLLLHNPKLQLNQNFPPSVVFAIRSGETINNRLFIRAIASEKER
ncbi:hypothetical protein HNY73_001011 [Argiope bruennichi]|uniref:Uncharacterized protein n=1 Tax=Argiope bruennichi TaxID=94029 RepID=A0A8T0G107_ARGBR|nr:hypothetical protein HNY73_001011 [Argiope bruennichi]